MPDLFKMELLYDLGLQHNTMDEIQRDDLCKLSKLGIFETIWRRPATFPVPVALLIMLMSVETNSCICLGFCLPVKKYTYGIILLTWGRTCSHTEKSVNMRSNLLLSRLEDYIDLDQNLNASLNLFGTTELDLCQYEHTTWSRQACFKHWYCALFFIWCVNRKKLMSSSQAEYYFRFSWTMLTFIWDWKFVHSHAQDETKTPL